MCRRREIDYWSSNNTGVEEEESHGFFMRTGWSRKRERRKNKNHVEKKLKIEEREKDVEKENR